MYIKHPSISLCDHDDDDDNDDDGNCEDNDDDPFTNFFLYTLHSSYDISTTNTLNYTNLLLLAIPCCCWCVLVFSPLGCDCCWPMGEDEDEEEADARALLLPQ